MRRTRVRTWPPRLLPLFLVGCASAPTPRDLVAAPPRAEPLPVAEYLRPPRERLGQEPLGAVPAYPNLYRQGELSLGGAFFGNFDTTIQVDGSAGVGAVLDLEDFLGVEDDNSVGRIDASYSFSPRHRLDLSIYDISRNGSQTISEDIEVGDIVIPAGRVHTSLDTQIVKLAYRYNFVADTRTAIGASFGFHGMGIDLGIESTSFDVSEKVKANVPLPVLGLHWEYSLSPRWKLEASSEVLQVDVGFARGFLSDSRLTLDHDLFDHLGWGFGFNSFQLDAEVEDGSLSADLEYAYQGLMLYIRGYL